MMLTTMETNMLGYVPSLRGRVSQSNPDSTYPPIHSGFTNELQREHSRRPRLLGMGSLE